MAKNSNLHAAKAAKNDEFYTQIGDVEREMFHYKDHFRDKIVFCNCDDPDWSAFWRYFHLNFEFLGLKKLIATHYDPVAPTYKLEYMGGNDTDISVGVRTELSENGDFRSPECLELLDECDIVCTNPPFSLFREYVAILMEHGKKFVIIGNKNVITYKEIFPYIRDDKLWIGSKSMGGSLWFRTPDGFENKSDKIVDGIKLTEVPCCWFTNLDHARRHEKLVLYRTYDPEKYPKYDNYDAINVDKVVDIPMDYFEHIGVPISFLDKYCPEQFEIVGATESEGTGFSNGLFRQTDRQTDASASDGQRQESLQAAVHTEKIKIVRQPDRSGKIFPQNGIDLQRLAAQFSGNGFTYHSGVVGVPITFLDKYCPDQFEILGIANSARYIGYECFTFINGRKIYNRILIRRILV